MNWRHLIEAARLLAGAAGGSTAPGRPRQAMLKRAVSAAYYAMFHALCASNADAIVGASPAPAHRPAWTRTYRALDHSFARRQMTRHRADLPSKIQGFATAFSDLQDQRHLADYDPDFSWQRPNVIRLIDRAESAIQAFRDAEAVERRDLATLVLFRNR